jgi:hypothetical protein
MAIFYVYMTSGASLILRLSVWDPHVATGLDYRVWLPPRQAVLTSAAILFYRMQSQKYVI